MALRTVPLTLRAANAFVARHHRHHKPARGCVFVAAVRDGERLCGVAIVGRPLARHLNDGRTCEIVRCCTDGTRNACSFLYGLCRRVAFALGYRLVLTYTLREEGGASLRAAGFVLAAEVAGREWVYSGQERSRKRRTLFGDEDKYPDGDKWRWEAAAQD